MKPLPLRIYREHAVGTPSGATLMYVLVSFLAICTLLYVGRDVIIPIVLAVLLAVLLAPAVRFLQRRLLPRTAAVLSIVILTFAVIFGVTFLIGRTLTDLAADLPRYESNLREKARTLKLATSSGETLEQAADVLKRLQSELDKPVSPAGAAPSAPPVRPIPVRIYDTDLGPLQPFAAVATAIAHPLAQVGIVILMLIFILFNREDLRNRFIRLAGSSDLNRTTLALDEAGNRLSSLFRTQLFLNATTGAFIGTALFLIGVPGAPLWGVLTAVLRFIPYIGTLLSAVFPVAIALAVGDGWLLGVAAAATVVGTEIVVGQVLEPLVFGKMTGLSPVAVVVAAAFWTAVWGPVGLVLSTPITVGLLVLGRHIESLKFLEVLLGSDEALPAESVFYQRMLAADPVEAAELAHDYEQEGRLEEYLLQVVVPGLLLAHHDQARGSLTRERTGIVAHSLSEMLTEAWPEIEARDDQPTVALVAAQGSLNFAAMLAVSALFRLKGISHVLLPEDTLAAGKTIDIPEAVDTVLVCYLSAPSEAQNAYILRRAASRFGERKLTAIAWSSPEDRVQLQTPVNAAAILPGAIIAAAPATPAVTEPAHQHAA